MLSDVPRLTTKIVKANPQCNHKMNRPGGNRQLVRRGSLEVFFLFFFFFLIIPKRNLVDCGPCPHRTPDMRKAKEIIEYVGYRVSESLDPDPS